jgi:hypothetical protein
MAVVYNSKGAAIDKGGPNSNQTAMRQIGRTFTWSGTSQYQTLMTFTKSGSSQFRFNMMLWYICSVRDNAEGRAGEYKYDSIYARYSVYASDSNIYNDQFEGENYPNSGTIALPIQNVSSTANNQAYIRFELPSGWSPAIITMGGFITCNRWDLLSISYP